MKALIKQLDDILCLIGSIGLYALKFLFWIVLLVVCVRIHPVIGTFGFVVIWGLYYSQKD